MKTQNKLLAALAFLGLIVALFFSCQQLGLAKEKTDNTPLIAAAALALKPATSSSVTSGTCNGVTTSTGTTVVNSTATLNTTSGCVNGVTTCMDSALPAWIKDNFKCAVGYVSGTNYVFLSQNVPNTKSAYFGNSSALYEAMPSGNAINPNSIVSQKFVYTIPMTPSKGSGTQSTQGGLSSIGITVNGLAVFNNAAAPGDTLSSETVGFDGYQGHPENSGTYHHHAAVPKVCGDGATTANSTSCNNSTLIGIALDGYAIYGQKCDKGTTSTADDTTPTDLDSLHGHTAVTNHFTTATYHYHYKNDTTATIYTLMGSFFYGNIGSVSK